MSGPSYTAAASREVANTGCSWSPIERQPSITLLDQDSLGAASPVLWDPLVHGQEASLWAKRSRAALRKRLAEDGGG